MLTLFDVSGLRLGLGLLRLCTEGRPPKEVAIAVIHRGLDLGIRVLDTGDSYCLSNDDFHYGETLAREAVDTWHGPRESVRILTKVGLVRPKGKWLPNGSPKHIRKSVDASLQALRGFQSLGDESLFLLQLHAKDPRVPFEDTLGCLAQLQREGKVQHLGLCNVGAAEVRQAQRHFQVASLQCELSVQSQKSATDGLVQLAKQLGIPFLAHRPLGGYAKVDKLAGNRVLKPIAERRGATPHQIALASLLAADEQIVPLIGATRIESLESSVQAAQMTLDESDRTAIAVKYSFEADPIAIASIQPQTLPAQLRELKPNEGPGDEPEVVLLMGIQGAGKSELVQSYVDRGYVRLNRDELGGKLEDLNDRLASLLAQGVNRVVMDNTYPTRVSRAGVVRASHRALVPVRCRWIDTPVEQARINIVLRTLARYETLLGPVEMKEYSKTDPNLPPPMAMQKWIESLEEPSSDEGFSAIDRIPFERRLSKEWIHKGLFLDVDGTLRITRSGEVYPRHADDVVLLPGRREVLSRWVAEGYQLFFVSNQSGVASGKLTFADAQSAFLRTAELLELPIAEIAFCPHPAFPVGCFCRKPMPGLGVYLARKHKLDLAASVMVGDMESDRQFAEGLGVKYVDSVEFFGQ